MKRTLKMKVLSFALAFITAVMLFPYGTLTAYAVNEETEADADENLVNEPLIEENDTATATEPENSTSAPVEEETEIFYDEYEIENTAMSAPPMTQIGGAAELNALTTLPDGVYEIENVGNDNYYMTVENNYAVAGYRMVQQNYSSNTPLTNFSRSSLFKVSRVGNTDQYVIRSMLNNRMSFVTGTDIDANIFSTGYINTDDSAVPDGATFTITYSGGNYIIKPYGSTSVLAAPNTTVSGENDPAAAQLILSTSSMAGNLGKWKFTAYTGNVKFGFERTQTAGMGNGLVKRNMGTVWLKSWSTVINANTPYLTVGPLSLDIAKSTWSSFDYSAKIEGKQCGDYTLKAEIRSGSLLTATHSDTYTYTVIPDIVGDEVIVQNAATGKCMEVESASTANGGVVQQWRFHTGSQARWIFELGGNGFFKIKNLNSGKYLGVDSTDITKVKQYTSISDYTLWKLTESTDGKISKYRISCKASALNGKVLSTPSSTSGDGTDLTMLSYTYDSDNCDMWECMRYLGEIQYWNSDLDTVAYWESSPTVSFTDYVNNSEFDARSGFEMAIAQWSSALGISLKTVSESSADINFYAVTPGKLEELTGKEHPNSAAGYTDNVSSEAIACVSYVGELKKITKIFSSNVYLIYRPSEDLTANEIKSLATHELGHALGYTGHSFSMYEVMFGAVRPFYQLSAIEMNHLAQVYVLTR